MPKKPIPEEDDESLPDKPVPLALPRSVAEVWERKKRIAQSMKDAEKMWAPIEQGMQAYARSLKWVHVIETLGR